MRKQRERKKSALAFVFRFVCQTFMTDSIKYACECVPQTLVLLLASSNAMKRSASLAFEFKSRSTRFHDNRILRKEPPFIGRFDCDALIVSFPFLRIFHQTLTDLRFSACFKIETFGLLPAHSNLLACLFLRHVSCRLNSGMCFACNFFNVIFEFKIWGKWLRTSLKSNTQFRGEKNQFEQQQTRFIFRI